MVNNKSYFLDQLETNFKHSAGLFLQLLMHCTWIFKFDTGSGQTSFCPNPLPLNATERSCGLRAGPAESPSMLFVYVGKHLKISEQMVFLLIRGPL